MQKFPLRAKPDAGTFCKVSVPEMRNETMDEIEVYERVSNIEHILMTRQSDLEPPHWLHEHSQYDEGFSFCFDCMESIIPDGEWGDEWGGGFECEEDSPEHCEKCGKLLQYTLTDYGVDNELGHFEEYPPENLDNPDVCYELYSIACGLYTDEQKRKFLKIVEPLVGN